MEIHDSELLELVRNDDATGFVLFHACIYRSNGIVFRDAQESGWQNFRLSFQGMRIEGERVLPNEYAHEGELWINGKKENGLIFLPANHDGDICLELVLSPLFETLKIHTTKVNSSLEGPYELETIWDAEGNRT